ncbi:MAG TPA: DNA polymerase III subunit delta', partial [Azoarcus sp.]|nr:DNA polymerase III subunit delta' [Azoarcus sp.]
MHPWLTEGWTQLVALGERLPQALLFAGPPGTGKRDLADAF